MYVYWRCMITVVNICKHLNHLNRMWLYCGSLTSGFTRNPLWCLCRYQQRYFHIRRSSRIKPIPQHYHCTVWHHFFFRYGHDLLEVKTHTMADNLLYRSNACCRTLCVSQNNDVGMHLKYFIKFPSIRISLCFFSISIFKKYVCCFDNAHMLFFRMCLCIWTWRVDTNRNRVQPKNGSISLWHPHIMACLHIHDIERLPASWNWLNTITATLYNLSCHPYHQSTVADAGEMPNRWMFIHA